MVLKYIITSRPIWVYSTVFSLDWTLYNSLKKCITHRNKDDALILHGPTFLLEINTAISLLLPAHNKADYSNERTQIFYTLLILLN